MSLESISGIYVTLKLPRELPGWVALITKGYSPAIAVPSWQHIRYVHYGTGWRIKEEGE
jgi:hypothetical protein